MAPRGAERASERARRRGTDQRIGISQRPDEGRDRSRVKYAEDTDRLDASRVPLVIQECNQRRQCRRGFLVEAILRAVARKADPAIFILQRFGEWNGDIANDGFQAVVVDFHLSE